MTFQEEPLQMGRKADQAPALFYVAAAVVERTAEVDTGSDGAVEQGRVVGLTKVKAAMAALRPVLDEGALVGTSPRGAVNTH